MTMVAVRRLSRDLRRLLPLAFLIGCSLLSIIYVRSYRQGWPVSQPYHTRKVGSIDEQRGSRSEEGIQTAKGAAKSQHGANRAAPEASTSGDGEVRVRLQQQPVRWPWEGVEGCSQYGIRFAERGTLPIVALSSYPGSGNTWTRYMLELASGVFTGSIYYDMGLYSIGYWGELSSPEEGTTIVQKVHDFGDDQVQRFNRTAIVIVRNPYRAVLSFHNYLFGGHKGMAPSSNYLRKGWRTFVMKQVFEWSAHVQKWTEPGNRVLVVHYEHLKSDPVGQLRRMLKFLNWPIDEERLKCVQMDQSGRAQRHQQHRPRAVTPFPSELRKMIDLSVKTIQNVLERRHLTPLPVGEYEFFNGVLSSAVGGALGSAVGPMLNVARGGESSERDTARALSEEEERMVERVVETVQKSVNVSETKGDGLLERFQGLMVVKDGNELGHSERTEDADGVAHRHPPHFPADVEPFPADVREIVEHGVGYVNQLLRRRGHPPLPLDRYSRSSGERLEECYAEEDFPSCLARVDAMNPPAPAPSLLAHATDLFSRLLGDPLRVNLRSGLGTASAPPALEDVPGAAALRADWNVFEMSRQEL
ncbi:uncharacterized protein LOC122393501 [Amphibalanus amphitrite]|uniref:uncharacterized protein LOC122393501 n=1 Tax=Amphibalanus amphitrite TaxID=1232801 RepID=UPI001C921916|nr:uncharacterized protein LOC122393501 [Amphibalanus amphitrite]